MNNAHASVLPVLDALPPPERLALIPHSKLDVREANIQENDRLRRMKTQS